jgi:membrane-associated phospholipid phosphatase
MKKYTFIFIFLMVHFYTHAQNLDIDILKKLHTQRNTKLDKSFCFISNANTYVHVGLPVAYYSFGLIKKDSVAKRRALQTFVGMGINAGATYFLKKAINRDRPPTQYPTLIDPLEERYFFSFPSGHTSTAFQSATAFSLYAKKWYYVVPAYSYATAVGYSRLHMGVHFPSDVFVGAILGTASALISNKATRFLQQRKWAKSTYKKLIL